MIDFGNGYKIKFDGHLNWMITKTSVNKKTGEMYDTAIAFYGTLRQALEMYVERYGINGYIEPIDGIETIIRKLDEMQEMIEKALIVSDLI